MIDLSDFLNKKEPHGQYTGLIRCTCKSQDKLDIEIKVEGKLDFEGDKDLKYYCSTEVLEDSIVSYLYEKTKEIAKYEIGPRIHPSVTFEDHLKNQPR